jgi:hypothetical protein
MHNKTGTLLMLLFIFMAILWPSSVKADNETGKRITLSGYVRDAQNGESLIGATIAVIELKTGTVTNLYGFYSLSLPPGTYTFVYSYVGYASDSRNLALKENTTFNIELKLESKQIDEIIVKSTRADDNVKRLEMSISKMEIKSIRKLPALMGEVDVLKAIQLMPGVQSTSEGSSNFSVRGGSYDQNLIMLDEATVYNASHLMGFFSVFNNDAIKDVKLYKGDIPAAAGGRLSSLLDVRMRDGDYKKLSGSGGIGTISSRLTLEGPIIKDKTSFIVSGRRTYLDIFTPLSSSEELKDNRLYFYDLNVKVNHGIDQNNRLFFSGYMGRDVFKNSFAAMDFGNRTFTARWNHLFSQKLFSNLSIVYTHYDYELGFASSESTKFTWKYNMTEAGLKYDYTWYLNPNNTIKFGVQSFFHLLDPGTVSSEGIYPTYSLPPNYALEHAIYLSNEQTLTDRLSVKYGIRYSLFQNIGEATIYNIDENYKAGDSIVYPKGDIFNWYDGLEPRAGLKYEFSDMSSVKLSYSRTKQYLQLASNSTAGTPLDLWFFSGPNVKPQVADQVAAGYFRNFFGDKLQASVELYYKDMRHTIDFRDHAYLYLNPKLEAELRFGKSKAYGAEFMLQFPEGKLNGWVCYTRSHAERTIEAINNGNPYLAPYDKPNNFDIVLNYELSKRVSLGGTWIYATGTPATFPTGRFIYGNLVLPVYSSRNAYRMPAYHRLDLSVTLKGKEKAKRLWQGEWNFSVYNAYARKNAWALKFVEDKDNPGTTYAEKIYLFSFVPSVTYNFKF